MKNRVAYKKYVQKHKYKLIQIGFPCDELFDQLSKDDEGHRLSDSISSSTDSTEKHKYSIYAICEHELKGKTQYEEKTSIVAYMTYRL